MDETLDRITIDVDSFHHLPVRLYALSASRSFDGRMDPPVAADVRFGDAIRLFGLDPGRAGSTPAGSGQSLKLFWEPLRSMSEDVSVSLRLTRGGQEWWRWDGSPSAPTYPTTYWKAGRPVRGGFRIEVPAGTPPGAYDLDLVLYERATGAVFIASAPGGARAETHRLGTIEVSRPLEPPAGAGPVAPLSQTDFGGVALVGGEVGASSARGGDQLSVGLAWLLTGDPAERVEELWLTDAGGRVWPLTSSVPVGGAYPVSQWATGELVVDRLAVRLPPGVAPGVGRIQASMRQRDSATPGSDRAADVARINVQSRPRSFMAPTPQVRVDAAIGELARLLGVDVPLGVDRGGILAFVLHWQARTETASNYSVFVHLVDGAERPVAQRDGAPGGGELPTAGWIAGEFLRDQYALAIPTSVIPGQYRLVAGLYDPRSGQRLPVAGPAGHEPGDRVVLTTVQVR